MDRRKELRIMAFIDMHLPDGRFEEIVTRTNKTCVLGANVVRQVAIVYALSEVDSREAMHHLRQIQASKHFCPAARLEARQMCILSVSRDVLEKAGKWGMEAFARSNKIGRYLVPITVAALAGQPGRIRKLVFS